MILLRNEKWCDYSIRPIKKNSMTTSVCNCFDQWDASLIMSHNSQYTTKLRSAFILKFINLYIFSVLNDIFYQLSENLNVQSKKIAKVQTSNGKIVQPNLKPNRPINLNPQYLRVPIIANRDPVGLGSPPLDLVDLAFSRGVRQDGVLDSSRHLLDVPDQGLVVVAGRADVAWTGMGISCYWRKGWT